ncbi:MAG: glycerate kinase [Chloroflexota bacterium]
MVARSDRRQLAWHLIQAALKAVDPAAAVKNYCHAHPQLVDRIKATSGRMFVIGAGKAGAPMALAAAEIFGDKIAGGRVVVKYGHGLPPPAGEALRQAANIEIVEAGHPVPDEAGLEASRQIVRLLADVGQDDTVICLISGGGSALLTLPAGDLTVGDLQATTQSLLAAGATINEINTIRKHLSAVKGGRLAELAAPANVYTLILSDVVGDPLDVIASGPTVPDSTTFAEAWRLVELYRLQERLPQAVIRRLQAGLAAELPDTPKAGNPIFERVHNAVVASNRIAARAAVAAAQAAGLQAQLLTTFIEGEAREVGKVLAGLAKGLIRDEAPLKRPACLVLGGETTVTLKGNGQGGRNQEMALAAAIALQGWDDVAVVCLGTDGSDGPTDAAGAVVDGHTLGRALTLGLDALDFLSRNDAYNFFAPLDDLIMTGPTQTNVNDLAFVMAW